MSFRRRLTGRCAILQPVEGAQDKWMNSTKEYVAPSTPVDLRAVPCFFYPGVGQEENDAQRIISVERAFFDFTKDTPITRRDRLQYNGEIYDIIRVNPVGGGHHLQVEAKQVEI